MVTRIIDVALSRSLKKTLFYSTLGTTAKHWLIYIEICEHRFKFYADLLTYLVNLYRLLQEKNYQK
ncbi:hypothetical protein NIES2100_76730 [Calothrix sp. NIES-2100]|nr:hypothetical protein NIES2100_76730 [Calothrix sp. NIES-2100]